mgnify:CR=1 FL=1
MNLNDLKNMIERDMVIDKTELDIESIKTPQMHNKYLTFMLDEKLVLQKMESDFSILRKKKWLYYTGKMSQEELNEEGLEPFQHNVLKTDIDKFIDSDEQIIDLKNKIFYQKEKVKYIEEVVKIISSRQWTIKSAIDWIKFTNGTN